VCTTVLNLTFWVIRLRMSDMTSSGIGEISKFAWIRCGLVEVVKKAAPRCTAQDRAT
jgi:hypothetical protein